MSSTEKEAITVRIREIAEVVISSHAADRMTQKIVSSKGEIVKRLITIALALALMGSAFAKNNVLDTPAVQSQISKLYSTAGPTLVFPGYPVEFAFTVRADGEVSAITSSHDRMQNHLRLFEGDVAIIHTHPAGADPRPSEGDILVATTKGVPNYELSKDALWVAMPDGTFHKVASVQCKHGGIILIYDEWKGR